MKMKPKHYSQLEQSIRLVQLEHPDATIQSYHEQGLTVKRLRWALFHVACDDGYFNRVLHAYLDDSHIDTALKRIVGA